MAFVLADRVREFSTTSGDGDFFLGGAVVGFQSFIDGVGAGNQTFYAISLPGSTAWEVGIGTVQIGQLIRNTVLESSNGDAKVDFPVGTKDVFVTYPADSAVYALGGTVVMPAGAVIPVSGGGTGNTTAEDEVTRLAAASNISAIGTAINAVTKTGTNAVSANNTWTGTNLFNGAVTMTSTVTLSSTTAVRVPAGTTAQRPDDAIALLRFNTETGEFEGNNGTAWASVGGSAISNDTATTTPLYPLFADATAGTAANVYTADDDYLYTPDTGTLEAPIVVASSGIFLNPTLITRDTTIPDGHNGSSAGPVEIDLGVTVTVGLGSAWNIS